MSRLRTLSITLGLILGLTATASAQQPGVGRLSTPRTSPYLNLLRQSSTIPGVNYYGIVRPEIQMRNNLQVLQQQIANNRQALTSPQVADNDLPVTGHVASFLNTGGYFMNFNAGGGFGGGSVGGGGGQRGGALGAGGGGNRGFNMNTSRGAAPIRR